MNSNGALVKKEKPEPAIVGLQQLEKAADYIVKSKLFGVQTKEQAVALMLLAQAEGIHPMRAIQEYHIIQGRPAMRADAMLARFLSAGGRVTWHELTDQAAEATFEHPAGGKVRIRWDMERAKKAGLLDKKNRDGSPNNWQKYPRAMLRARVISEGIRTVYPNVIVGVYTPEEIQDFDVPETVEAEIVSEEKPVKRNGNGQTPSPTTKSKDHSALIARFKELYEKLRWSPEEGRAFIRKLFGKDSTKDLTNEELAQAVERMAEMLEMAKQTKQALEEDIPVAPPQSHLSPENQSREASHTSQETRENLAQLWKEIHAVVQKAGFKWEAVQEEIKKRYGVDDPDKLTAQQAREFLEFLKEHSAV